MVIKKNANKEKVSGLKSHIGFWLRLVSNHVSYAFARKLEKSGVTVAEWVILREMYGCEDTTTPGEVAKLTGLTKGAVSKLVDRLLEKKLVERRTSKEDRRYQDIHLTHEAQLLVPEIAALADLNDQEFFSALSKKEREDLVSILQTITTANQIHSVPVE